MFARAFIDQITHAHANTEPLMYHITAGGELGWTCQSCHAYDGFGKKEDDDFPHAEDCLHVWSVAHSEENISASEQGVTIYPITAQTVNEHIANRLKAKMTELVSLMDLPDPQQETVRAWLNGFPSLPSSSDTGPAAKG